jgi:hypothetical protein
LFIRAGEARKRVGVVAIGEPGWNAGNGIPAAGGRDRGVDFRHAVVLGSVVVIRSRNGARASAAGKIRRKDVASEAQAITGLNPR